MTIAKTKYKPIIGLEVHAQLNTTSKLFCGCRAQFGADPNSLTCPVCLGHPGALPVVNKRAVEYTIKTILALGAKVQLHSAFARKNYFYPDLPKGYQISQYDSPLGLGGAIQCQSEGSPHVIRIKRIHLEEDAGKLLHPEADEDNTLIDFNRCGVPLVEIVSEPDINSPQVAYLYLKKMRQVLQYIGVCSGDMEKGALRCDANVSICRRGDDKVGIRTEVKNLNSFKAVEKAIAHEIKRQIELVDSGEEVSQVTLMWDEPSASTEIMRTKEECDDYRYFPEPDLPPLIIKNEWIEEIKAGLPELPDTKRDRFVTKYGLSESDASVLTSIPNLADYYEMVVKVIDDKKLASNWVTGDLLMHINDASGSIEEFIVQPKMLAELLQNIKNGHISGTMAKEVLSEMVRTGKSADDVINEKNLCQIVDKKELTAIIENVLVNQSQQVQLYRDGRTQLFDFFIGQVMKETGGKANPVFTGQILRKLLDG